mmetsp:Transcript_140191/g.349417  ORF Transcript_140191/g.349417 Transcript_140191/m.349417 type:complete len:344 (-) Transcript_140191:139-1170(-)
MPFRGHAGFTSRFQYFWSTWASLLCLPPHILYTLASPVQQAPALRGQMMRGHHRGGVNSGLEELEYHMPHDFEPQTDRDPILPSRVRVKVLSSSKKGHFGKNGTIVFLHGAGGQADEYNHLWKNGEIDLPSGFTIVFVQSPRGSWDPLPSPWLRPTKYGEDQPRTLEWQVNDDVQILKHVLQELQEEAGGYSKLWLTGRSQGACLSVLLAVAGVGPTVAGAFAIAATALPQLQSIPFDGTYTAPSHDKLKGLRLGFYTGDRDTQFTGHHPWHSGGTFPLLKQTLTDLGFFSGDDEDHFWLKEGAGHGGIGPDAHFGADAFKVLFAFILKQDPTKAGVHSVTKW